MFFSLLLLTFSGFCKDPNWVGSNSGCVPEKIHSKSALNLTLEAVIGNEERNTHSFEKAYVNGRKYMALDSGNLRVDLGFFKESAKVSDFSKPLLC